MAITPIYVSMDLGAAGHADNLRVLAADKIGVEKTCRAQGWEYADGPRAHTLMCYYAYQRVNGEPYGDYTQFMHDLVDYSITTTAPDVVEDPTVCGTGSWPTSP